MDSQTKKQKTEVASESDSEILPIEQDINSDEESSESIIYQLDKNLLESIKSFETIKDQQIPSKGESLRDDSKSTALKVRLKRARAMDSETSLIESDTIKQSEDFQYSKATDGTSSLGTRQFKSKYFDEADEIELLLEEDDDYDDDDDEEEIAENMLKTPKCDTIKAKMEFLKHFQIPSISDMFETTEDEQVSCEKEFQTEDLEKAERRARLKRARDIRFKTGELETSLADIAKSSTKTQSGQIDSEYDETDEMKWFFVEEDDVVDEEEDAMLRTPKGDTIKAKMEFLKHFELPSLSDISLDTEDADQNE